MAKQKESGVPRDPVLFLVKYIRSLLVWNSAANRERGKLGKNEPDYATCRLTYNGVAREGQPPKFSVRAVFGMAHRCGHLQYPKALEAAADEVKAEHNAAVLADDQGDKEKRMWTDETALFVASVNSAVERDLLTPYNIGRGVWLYGITGEHTPWTPRRKAAATATASDVAEAFDL